MLNFYYSEDLGLLDYKARLFKKENPNCVCIKNSNFDELFMALTQTNLINDSNSFLIEGYSDSLDNLTSIFSLLNLDSKNILFLVWTSSEITLKKEFLSFCSNEDPKIKSLDSKTKRSYIGNLIKHHKIKISPDLVKVIKDALPPNACEINDFMVKLSCSDLKKLDEKKLLSMMGDTKTKVDYFSFFYMYMKENMDEWILFFNKNVVCTEGFKKLLHSFVYKLMDMKRFLTFRRDISDMKKISSKINIQYYFLFEFEKIWELYGENLFIWLDELIINLYFFYCNQAEFRLFNFDFFRFFLLQQRIKLIKVV